MTKVELRERAEKLRDELWAFGRDLSQAYCAGDVTENTVRYAWLGHKSLLQTIEEIDQ